VGVSDCKCALLVREDYSIIPVYLIKGQKKRMRTRDVVCISGCALLQLCLISS